MKTHVGGKNHVDHERAKFSKFFSRQVLQYIALIFFKYSEIL